MLTVYTAMTCLYRLRCMTRSRFWGSIFGGVLLVGLFVVAQGFTPLGTTPPATSLTSYDDLYLDSSAADSLLLTAAKKTKYQGHDAYQLTLNGEVTAWAMKGKSSQLVALIHHDMLYDPLSAVCFTSNGYTICLPTTAGMPLKWVTRPGKRPGLTYVDPEK